MIFSKKQLMEPKEDIEKAQERTSELLTLSMRELNDLDDVEISDPQNGDVLTYNSTSGKWENSAP